MKKSLRKYLFFSFFILIWIEESIAAIKNDEFTTESPTTMRKHYFEGVDWTIHPWPYKERVNCHGHYINCVKRTTPLITVCAYNTHSGYFDDYYNICELDLSNCEYRMNKHRNMGSMAIYSGTFNQDYIYHNGEDRDCERYKYLFSGNENGYKGRRFTYDKNKREEAEYSYFGGPKEQVLAEWRRDNAERYKYGDLEPDIPYAELPNFDD